MTKKIYWDPGHGGADSGAVGNDLQEKELTLQIVRYAMEHLKNNYTGFEQRATRNSDTTVELSTRDDDADKWGADVFISVHINAAGGSGFESYIFKTASAATVALQNIIHSEVLAAMRASGNTIDRGKKRANFSVIRETEMPAILTENLFIDSNDANRLKSETFLKAIGEAHARGVAKFLGLQTKPKQEAPAPAKAVQDKIYKVQVGAFRDRTNAEKLAQELKQKGYATVITE